MHSDNHCLGRMITNLYLAFYRTHVHSIGKGNPVIRFEDALDKVDKHFYPLEYMEVISWYWLLYGLHVH